MIPVGATATLRVAEHKAVTDGRNTAHYEVCHDITYGPATDADRKIVLIDERVFLEIAEKIGFRPVDGAAV